jgi:hypothetical protein
VRKLKDPFVSRILIVLLAAAGLWLASPVAANMPACQSDGTCPVCGDGICDPGESCSNCPADCGTCSPVCGNGICEAGETCSNCPADCGTCAPVCGNGLCEPGETCTSCSHDCGPCPGGPICGNSLCEAGETCSNCPADCGPCPPPPPPKCNPPQACKPVCGNGICETGEDCNNCAVDCGSCPGRPVCGDGVCDPTENCNFCWVDCCPGGGGEGAPCSGNSNCFGWGNLGCDKDTHTCCDVSDLTCNADPLISSIPRRVPQVLMAANRGGSLPGWLLTKNGGRCNGGR